MAIASGENVTSRYGSRCDLSAPQGRPPTATQLVARRVRSGSFGPLAMLPPMRVSASPDSRTNASTDPAAPGDRRLAAKHGERPE
jgi:hypothetical protein